MIVHILAISLLLTVAASTALITAFLSPHSSSLWIAAIVVPPGLATLSLS